ncbi:MAG: DnaB-like helicase C-terminal domain-containing protein, partial [Acidimicrobiales bacterium]
MSSLPRSQYKPIRGLLAQIEDEGMMKSQALPTGFNPLDAMLDGGLHPHDLSLLAGKPSVGKTIATLQWARHIAANGGHVAYVSYEHSEQSLLSRLLNLELSECQAYADETATETMRRRIKAWAAGRLSFDELAGTHPAMEATIEDLMSYASRMFLIQGSAVTTDVHELSSIARHVVGPGGLLIVDYLQKVPVEGGASLGRAPEIASALKEIAMGDHVAVLAIAAVGMDGLGQRRIRPEHLASNAPLVHEADCAIVMNEKAPAISRVHTAFDGRQIDEARSYTLFTIEKHRDGPANVDLEF